MGVHITGPEHVSLNFKPLIFHKKKLLIDIYYYIY